jgi:hypothetical protein
MMADDDRCASGGGAVLEGAFSLVKEDFGWLSVGDRRTLVGDCKDFRKPMLYPLSYEGRHAASSCPEPTVLALVRGFDWAAASTARAAGSVSQS